MNETGPNEFWIKTVKESNTLELVKLRHELKKYPNDAEFLKVVDEELKIRENAKTNL